MHWQVVEYLDKEKIINSNKCLLYFSVLFTYPRCLIIYICLCLCPQLEDGFSGRPNKNSPATSRTPSTIVKQGKGHGSLGDLDIDVALDKVSHS